MYGHSSDAIIFAQFSWFSDVLFLSYFNKGRSSLIIPQAIDHRLELLGTLLPRIRLARYGTYRLP